MGMPTKILPAIIAIDQHELDAMLNKLKGVSDWVMLDFMDGKFVPSTSLTFQPKLPSQFKYEAHLMVEDPLSWVEELKDDINVADIHIESRGFNQALKKAKDHGIKVYAAINPSTSIDRLTPHLESVDGVLVMTVEPGHYGSPFVPSALDTVQRLRETIPELDIEVDGAMNPENILKAREAGANIFASGSYIMKSTDIASAMRRLVEATLS
jgi:ribulose-phosphate 3-epimerase